MALPCVVLGLVAVGGIDAFSGMVMWRCAADVAVCGAVVAV
jgi:hypothetical protein